MRRTLGALAALAVAAGTAVTATAPAWADPPPPVIRRVATTSTTMSTMPYAAGLKLADAQQRVAYAGLSPYVRYIDNDCAANRVISQDPGAGTVLPSGTQVFLFVHPICNGPQP